MLFFETPWTAGLVLSTCTGTTTTARLVLSTCTGTTTTAGTCTGRVVGLWHPRTGSLCGVQQLGSACFWTSQKDAELHSWDLSVNLRSSFWDQTFLWRSCLAQPFCEHHSCTFIIYSLWINLIFLYFWTNALVPISDFWYQYQSTGTRWE